MLIIYRCWTIMWVMCVCVCKNWYTMTILNSNKVLANDLRRFHSTYKSRLIALSNTAGTMTALFHSIGCCSAIMSSRLALYVYIICNCECVDVYLSMCATVCVYMFIYIEWAAVGMNTYYSCIFIMPTDIYMYIWNIEQHCYTSYNRRRFELYFIW